MIHIDGFYPKFVNTHVCIHFFVCKHDGFKNWYWLSRQEYSMVEFFFLKASHIFAEYFSSFSNFHFF